MLKYKFGVTPLSISLIVAIMIILLSTVVIKTFDIVSITKTKKVASEFLQIEMKLKEYNARTNGNLGFEEVSLNISEFDAEQLKTYEYEPIIEETKIILYEVNLSRIDASLIKYGSKRDPKDRYLYSLNTNKVYYEKGIEVGGVRYYKLNDELIEYIK